jgi:hypothetical protein
MMDRGPTPRVVIVLETVDGVEYNVADCLFQWAGRERDKARAAWQEEFLQWSEGV